MSRGMPTGGAPAGVVLGAAFRSSAARAGAAAAARPAAVAVRNSRRLPVLPLLRSARPVAGVTGRSLHGRRRRRQDPRRAPGDGSGRL